MIAQRGIASAVCLLWLAVPSVGTSGQPTAAAAQQLQWPDQGQAGPFRIHADFPLEPLMPLLQELHQLSADLQQELGVGPPREWIYVFLFRHRSTYDRYVKQHFPQAPARRALFIKQRGPGMVFAYVSDKLAADLRHECTHALLHARLPMVPLWLDEGLAEYFEVPADQRASRNPHHGSVRWAVRLRSLSDIERLESLGDVDAMGRAEYRDSWAWVHFMLHGPPQFRTELQRYLQDIEQFSASRMLTYMVVFAGRLAVPLRTTVREATSRTRSSPGTSGTPRTAPPLL
jgi:hypothetical protein